MDAYFVAIFGGLAIMALIFIVGSATAKPKGADLEFLISGVGEEVLSHRVCNACIPDAQMSAMANFVVGQVEHGDVAAELALDFVRGMTGGVWVGGRVFVTSRRLVFMPNGLNRALHERLSVIAIPWSDISELRQRFGVATQIADAITASGTFTFRCYGMNSLLAVAQDATLLAKAADLGQ